MIQSNLLLAERKFILKGLKLMNLVKRIFIMCSYVKPSQFLSPKIMDLVNHEQNQANDFFSVNVESTMEGKVWTLAPFKCSGSIKMYSQREYLWGTRMRLRLQHSYRMTLQTYFACINFQGGTKALHSRRKKKTSAIMRI